VCRSTPQHFGQKGKYQTLKIKLIIEIQPNLSFFFEALTRQRKANISREEGVICDVMLNGQDMTKMLKFPWKRCDM